MGLEAPRHILTFFDLTLFFITDIDLNLFLTAPESRKFLEGLAKRLRAMGEVKDVVV